jgi:hypothetical protein
VAGGQALKLGLIDRAIVSRAGSGASGSDRAASAAGRGRPPARPA